MQDIRWMQRFENFEKAIKQLEFAVNKKTLNEIELQGLVQCFEYSFELAWKTMKDYLEQNGYEVTSPRNTIQTAFSSNLIKDGHVWIEALESRNLMSHTYDEVIFEKVIKLIKEKYYKMLKTLYSNFVNIRKNEV
jgi:nucleotidyltransferase substrate binding protein (TIGR01987 family)